MERKIGEIFEYNGEWYQCIKQTEKYNKTVCNPCDFHGIGNCELDRCSGTYRSDKKSVIFKKLEKVGEPTRLYNDIDSLFQTYKLFVNAVIPKDFGRNYSMFPDNSYIKIEIKENKEDMEENNLKHSNFVRIGKNLKPFDLEQAKAGKPVCTKDGRKARIICFDAKGTHPIIALVSDPDIEGAEIPFCYTNDGFYNNPNCESNHDLMMLPEKKEGWINIYKGSKLDSDYLYSTKKDAINNIFLPMKARYIDTIKIEWEE